MIFNNFILIARCCPSTQLLPAPVWPKTKLSGRNNWPNGPARTLSIVPGTEMLLMVGRSYRLQSSNLDNFFEWPDKTYFKGMINVRTICKHPSAWFQIHQHCTRHIASTSCFVEVNIDTFLNQSGKSCWTTLGTRR